MGLSVASHAADGNWVWYKFDENNKLNVRPQSAEGGDRKVPKGDCWEMMCQYGCVENEEGPGKCCPNVGNTGDSCTVAEGMDVAVCCSKNNNNGNCANTSSRTWYDKNGQL